MANIFTVIPNFLDAFKKGKEVANAAAWKSATVATNVVVGFLGALLAVGKSFGYDLGVSQDVVANLGAGIVAAVSLVNAVMHVVTSARVGLSSSDSGGAGGASPGAGATV